MRVAASLCIGRTLLCSFKLLSQLIHLPGSAIGQLVLEERYVHAAMNIISQTQLITLYALPPGSQSALWAIFTNDANNALHMVNCRDHGPTPQPNDLLPEKV